MWGHFETLQCIRSEHAKVTANRVDARIVDRERATESNRITLLEMSSSWVENHQVKEEEKEHLELKRHYPGFEIKQANVYLPPWGILKRTQRQCEGISWGREMERYFEKNAEICFKY